MGASPIKSPIRVTCHLISKIPRLNVIAIWLTRKFVSETVHLGPCTVTRRAVPLHWHTVTTYSWLYLGQAFKLLSRFTFLHTVTVIIVHWIPYRYSFDWPLVERYRGRGVPKVFDLFEGQLSWCYFTWSKLCCAYFITDSPCSFAYHLHTLLSQALQACSIG